MDKRMLKIIYTSDTHGHVYPVDYPTGKKENSGLLNMACQTRKDGNTLILDGGDTLQGTPFSQYYIAHSQEYSFHPMAEAFNALGCDYYTLGNHDFNFGYEALREYIGAMDAQCLCANLEDLGGELGVKKDVIHVLENGLRVGITGIVTDYVMIWEQSRNLERLRVTDAFTAAKAECEKLKSQCDICLCIYHGGFEEDLVNGQVLSISKENIACKIARELEFDLLLTGHQHMLVEGVLLGGTYAVQPAANAGHYVELEVEETVRAPGDKANGTVQDTDLHGFSIKSSVIQVEAHHGEQPYQKLLPVEEAVQKWLDEPVGILAEEIKPEEKLQAALYGSRLAALFNEVQLDCTGADFSCTSLGNRPVGLKRRVTMRDICGAYLFANTLVVLEVGKEEIKAALERCASYFVLKDGEPQVSDEFLKPKIEHYNYDFYAGLDYEFDLRKPVGERVVRLRKSDGTRLTDRKYRLVTSNYRATGTGGYEAIGNCPVLWRGATEMPELIADYIRNHSPLLAGGSSNIMVKWK